MARGVGGSFQLDRVKRTQLSVMGNRQHRGRVEGTHPEGGGETLKTTCGARRTARAFLVVVAATLSVSLCGGQTSEARALRRALVASSERTLVWDALAASNASNASSIGVEGTGWTGRADGPPWTWTARFARPAHIALVRAHFGESPTRGVPVAFRWESLAASADGELRAGRHGG